MKRLNRGFTNPLTYLAITFTTAITLNVQAAQSVLLPSIPEFRTSQLGKLPDFEISTQLPVVADKLPLMTIVPPGDVAGYAQTIAGSLEMTGEFRHNGKGKMKLRVGGAEPDQQRSLTVFEASGGFFYEYDNRLYRATEKQPRLPDRETAYNIAVEFLQTHGLLSEDLQTDRGGVVFTRSKLTQFDAVSNEDLQEIYTDIDVRFPQQWEGFAVTGPGSKTYVSIGDGGSVLGLTRMHRHAKASSEYLNSIPPQQALAYLGGPQSRVSVPVGCTKAIIQSMTLAYWSDTPRVPQRVALPLYQIGGTCYSAENASLGSFAAYAPAVLNGAFKLQPEGTPDQHDEESF